MEKNITNVAYSKNKIVSLMQIIQQLNLQSTESNIKVMESIFKIVQNWDLELTEEDVEALNKTKTE